MCLVLLLAWGCGKDEPPPKPPYRSPVKKAKPIIVPKLSAAQLAEAKALAAQHCARCHLPPKPEVLDRRGWVEVMGKMKLWLGLEPIPDETPGHLRNLYPTNAVVAEAQWQQVRDYFVAQSADKLVVPPGKFAGEAKAFEEVDANINFGAFILTARVQPKTGAVWVSQVTAGYGGVYRRDPSGKWSEPIDWGSGPTQMRFTKEGMFAVMIRDYFPHDRADGYLVKIVGGKSTTVLDKLRRPTDVLAEDFTGDGKLDLVVCEYGNLAGGITWLNGTEGSKRKVLLEQPGILNAAAADFDGDGNLDFAALTAQAREMVMLFIGDGKGGFDPRAVLPRHPGWGHSHLAVADFNGDNAPDLLITNGDNGDLLDPPLRPYNGVRIHLNDGKGNFADEKFFQQPGAYRALARDFDGDGDLDIASISFFADYVNDPESALIYLRQEAPMQFTRLKLPGAQKARWITMDAGDIDADGDTDLIIAALNLGPGTRQIPTKTRRRWGREEVPVLILRNKSK